MQLKAQIESQDDVAYFTLLQQHLILWFVVCFLKVQLVKVFFNLFFLYNQQHRVDVPDITNMICQMWKRVKK